MDIIAFIGLHGAGKTFLSKRLSEKIKIPYINKRDLFKAMSRKLNKDKLNWELWYRGLYKTKGGYEIMKMIIKFLKNEYKEETSFIIDSIHNFGEIEYLKNNHKLTTVLVVCPKEERRERLIKRDSIVKSDLKRVGSAHALDKEHLISCLYTEANWSFCNYGSSSFIDLQMKEFIKFRE